MIRPSGRAWFFLACLALAPMAAAQPLQPVPRTPGEPTRLRPRVEPRPLGGTTIIRDIEYANVDGVSLRLDLYLPQPADNAPEGAPDRRQPALHPLIVWIHGGGWRDGDKGTCPVTVLTRRGYAIASINYRLTGVAPFPAQIHDCKGAIRWLRARAAEHNIDARRVGVWGASAGGHLSALIGTSSGVQDLEGDVGGNLEHAGPVQAVCNWFGPSDLLALSGNEFGEVGPLLDALMGGPIRDRAALARKASPITHIDAGDPPFLIMHGDADRLVPVGQSHLLEAALKRAGVPATLHVVEGAGHGFLGQTGLALSAAFFDEHLKKQPEPAPIERIDFSFKVPAGGDLRKDGPPLIVADPSEEYVFDGRIELPPKDRRNGAGVVLLGGGLASDMDWLIPADSTMDGAESRDAARLAAALVERGFVVMRWTSFRRDDPLRAQDPAMGTLYSYVTTLGHARRALFDFRQRDLVEPDRIILIGHSLGARRAFHMAESDEGIAGVVALGGAVLARTGVRGGEIEKTAWPDTRPDDADGNGSIDEPEYEKWRAAARPDVDLPFADLDFDGNQRLSHWEMAAARIARWRAESQDHPSLERAGIGRLDIGVPGMTWCEDVMVDRNIPALIIFGSLDRWSVQAPLLRKRAADAALADVTVRCYPDLGHQLTPEREGKFGPMSDEVIRDVADWAAAHARPAASPRQAP